MTTGQRIRVRRLELGMKQSELARKSYVSTGFISRLESDQTNASAKVLQLIAQALNVNIDTLFSHDIAAQYGIDTLEHIGELYKVCAYAEILVTVKHARGAEYFSPPQRQCYLDVWEARAQFGLSQFDHAITLCIGLIQRNACTDNYWNGMLNKTIGEAMCSLQRYDDALVYLMDAHRALAHSPHTELYRQVVIQVGVVYINTNQYDDALKHLKEAHENVEQDMISNVRQNANVLLMLSKAQWEKGNHDDAIECAKQSYRHLQFIGESAHDTLQHLIHMLRQLNRDEEANEYVSGE